ncbi:hypothetical protein DFH09DRAFT_1128711 [Mycena vulgaris]|nr:hypothetical protein DFH09DRAFT_1128711 [Mycena vulgaris]
MFRQGFVPVVLASVGIGIKLYRMAWVDPPMGPLVESYLNSCSYSKANIFGGFLCVLEPYFKQLVSNDVGKSLLTACGTFGMVLSTHFHITGGQGGASRLFSPLVNIAHTLAGQGYGAGFVGPIVLPALIALSKSLASPHAPLPSPTPFPYAVTVLGMHFVVFMLSGALTAIPPSTAAWTYVNYAFQLFPLLFIPLGFFPEPDPKATAAPPPKISVTVFKVYKYMYAPLWWITVAQGLNGYYRLNQGFSAPDYFMAVDFAGMVLTFLGMYAIDYIAGDAVDTLTIQEVALGLVLAGPTATMAAYFEAKERKVVERAERKQKALYYHLLYPSTAIIFSLLSLPRQFLAVPASSTSLFPAQSVRWTYSHSLLPTYLPGLPSRGSKYSLSNQS